MSENQSERKTLAGLFSKTERDLILKTLGEKNIKGPCELCGNPSWTLSNFLISPFPLARMGDGTVSFPLGGAQSHPSILIHCTNCGNTKMLNLGILGLTYLLKSDDNILEENS